MTLEKSHNHMTSHPGVDEHIPCIYEPAFPVPSSWQQHSLYFLSDLAKTLTKQNFRTALESGKTSGTNMFKVRAYCGGLIGMSFAVINL